MFELQSPGHILLQYSRIFKLFDTVVLKQFPIRYTVYPFLKKTVQTRMINMF